MRHGVYMTEGKTRLVRACRNQLSTRRRREAGRENMPRVDCSSMEGNNSADLAVDGAAGSRWASEWGVDPQWIYVDLGATAQIDRVRIQLEVFEQGLVDQRHVQFVSPLRSVLCQLQMSKLDILFQEHWNCERDAGDEIVEAKRSEAGAGSQP